MRILYIRVEVRMRASIAIGIVLGALLLTSPAAGQDSTSTHVYTGAGGDVGLRCSAEPPGMRCSGFLASDVDGTLLDVTVIVPTGDGPFPLVAFVHGYGGSKNSDSSYGDALAKRGYVVLRHSTRGFGESWGQVNLADIDVEVADLRSLIRQAAADPRLLVNPDSVAVAGASYGGGHSWLAAANPTIERPGQTPIRIRTVVPIAAWTDLLAALRPNGSATDSVNPPGFFKLSFLEGLFAGGIRTSLTRPYRNYPDYLVAWNTYAAGTEPNNLPPVGSSLVAGLTQYRSIYWRQEFWNAVRSGQELPIFLVQGFTDDLFPAPEALRMYDALRAIDPSYPVAAYFGDIGHPRAANKPGEIDYALNQILAWLDFYLKGTGTPPAGVSAAITRPGPGFDPADVVQAPSYDALSTATASARFPRAAVLTFDPANLSGLFVDPFVFVGCEELSANPCSAPPPDEVPGDVATYSVSASDLAASAGHAPGSFLIAGAPAIDVVAMTGAPRIQLDARIWDRRPDGTRTLVTRGTVTVDNGALPIGRAQVHLPTYGNLWELPDGDTLQLELTNVDSPYITPSRIPSVTVVRDVRLTVPIR